MKTLYTIGDISRLFNINISTLRYYNDIGLLIPKHIDERSHYRYYGIEQFEDISMIAYFKRMSLPIKMIKAFLTHRNPEESKQRFSSHLDDIEKQIEALNMIKSELTYRLHDLDRAGCVGQFEIKYFNKRYVVTTDEIMDCNETIDYNLTVLSDKCHAVFTGRYGMLTSMDNMNKKLFLEVSLAGDFILESGNYLVYRYKGRHKDSFHVYDKMKDYARENNLLLNNTSVEITLINDAYTTTYDDYVTEIQIQIKARDI